MPQYSDRREYTRTSHSPSVDSDIFPDAGPTLRSAFRIPAGMPINLNFLPDPPPGERPAAPLETLTQLAIYGSPRGKLTLQEIYSAIEERFEYYRTTDRRWKASIRHMLSLKSIFVSTERPPTAPGRGNYWQLDATVTIKYKRPRKRRVISRGANSTRSSSSDGSDDSKNRVGEVRHIFSSPAPDTTSGSDEKKPCIASPILPFSMDEYQSAGFVHHPRPSVANSFNYDSLGLSGDRALGLSQALTDPSCDTWWGQIPASSPDPMLSDHSLGLPKLSYRPRVIRTPQLPAYLM
ncbi:MAG: hypothetical protein NXY57DRAFT_1039670 [Lentinula lateritia]|nr:MAG: hypothetical protein NXY57DRAFT_1039670 [Lentinula lateritia]